MSISEQLAREAFNNMKIEGKTLKEWTEEIGRYKAEREAIVFCRDCRFQHDKSKCYLEIAKNAMGYKDDDGVFDEFWCKDGTRRATE